jgi:transmembrane sensor
MVPTNAEVLEAIGQQAGHWFVANRAGPLSESDRAAFVAWLRASPVHVEEYLGMAAIARDLPAAADDPAAPLEMLLAAASAEAGGANVIPLLTTRMVPSSVDPAPRRRTWTLLAIAAVLVLSLSTGWWVREDSASHQSQTFQTARGEQNSWQLPDGSVLRLNTGSLVAFKMSSRERVLTVARGQAFVRVSPDRRRRLRVEAGDTQVIAIGTEFDVYRRRDETIVTVVEGQVAVVTGAVPVGAGEGLPATGLRVAASQQVRVTAGVVPARATEVDLHRTMAWLDHRIAFDQQPLGTVADQFNDYGPVRLEIDDPALRALPVSGVFDAYDVDSFAAFVATLDGVTVRRIANTIRITHAPSAAASRSDSP